MPNRVEIAGRLTSEDLFPINPALRWDTSDRNFTAGWSSPVAREAHNLEVVGSNPAPATLRLPGRPL